MDGTAAQAKAVERPSWVLWLSWLLATVAGYVAGAVPGIVIGVAVLAAAYPNDAIMGSAFADFALVLLPFAFALPFSILTGLTTGLTQWLVLRRYLGNLSVVRWVSATVTALVLALAAAVLLGLLLNFIMQIAGTFYRSAMTALIGAAAGVVFGWVQRLVLQRYVEDDMAWVVTNAIAWGAGTFVSYIYIFEMGAVNDIGAFIGFFAVGATVFVLAGALSGRALIALMRDYQHNRSN
jgi:hypothetical protein